MEEIVMLCMFIIVSFKSLGVKMANIRVINAINTGILNKDIYIYLRLLSLQFF